MKHFSVFAIALLMTSSFSTPAHAESKTFWQGLKDGYRDQARGFSDETLVDQLNGSDWGWAWIKPNHVIDEANSRISQSSDRALTLTKIFLTSFEARGIKGSYAGDVFVHALSNSAPSLKLNKLSEIDLLIPRIGKVFATEYQPAAESVFFEKVIAPAYREALSSNFDSSVGFYKILQASSDQTPGYSWLASLSQSNSMRIQLLKSLVQNAKVENYSFLEQLYSKRVAGLEVTTLLAKMFSLQPNQTVQLVRQRIEGFDETKESLSTILDDIAFLKQNASKEVIAALSSKLVRLFNLAMQQNDSRAQSTISDSLGSGRGSQGNEGAGASGTSVRWSDLSQGSSSCSLKAKSALEFYRRGLISAGEINSALTELGDVRCGQDDAKRAVVGTLITVCEEAKKKKDDDVLKSCFSEVFVPLAKWVRDYESERNNIQRPDLYDSWSRGINAMYRLLTILGDPSSIYTSSASYGNGNNPVSIPQRSDYAEIRCEMTVYDNNRRALITVAENNGVLQQVSPVAENPNWYSLERNHFYVEIKSDGTRALSSVIARPAPCSVRISKNPQFLALIQKYNIGSKTDSSSAAQQPTLYSSETKGDGSGGGIENGYVAFNLLVRLSK